MHKRNSVDFGFTIVELLVVIVVIGILATVVIVNYIGISQRAVVASLKSDLTISAKQLKLFLVEHDSYPATISINCSTQPDSASDKCLGPSSGNTYLINEYSGTASTFRLLARNGTTTYGITHDSAPGEIAPITAIASINGTAQRGIVLTAGALTPAGATATYQWYSSATAGGTYLPIAGANTNTYRPVLSDVGMFIKVVATGSGTYWDSATSSATAQISPVSPTVVLGSLTNFQTWGVYAYLDPGCCDYEFNQPSSTFNLGPFVNGTMEDVVLSWSIDDTSPQSVTRRIMADSPRSTLLSIADGNVIPTSYGGANLTGYVNTKRGLNCQINWEIDTPSPQVEAWYNRLVSNSRLTFTWIPD